MPMRPQLSEPSRAAWLFLAGNRYLIFRSSDWRSAWQNSFPWIEEIVKPRSSFLVYPEGTRSPDGRLHRFKKGAFVMAIEAGVPVVPVACSGAHRIMPKNLLAIHPGDVTVQFGSPIDASEYTI